MLWKKSSVIAEFSPVLPFHWSVVAFCGQIFCIYEYETHLSVLFVSCQICGGPAAALVMVCVLLLWQLKATEVSGPTFRIKSLPHQYVLLCLLHSFVFLILTVAGGFPSSGNVCGSPFDRFYY